MRDGRESNPHVSALTGPRVNQLHHHPLKSFIGVTYPIQVSSEGIYLLLNTKLTKIPS